jgi:hypothetical protein
MILSVFERNHTYRKLGLKRKRGDMAKSGGSLLISLQEGHLKEVLDSEFGWSSLRLIPAEPRNCAGCTCVTNTADNAILRFERNIRQV